MPFPTIVVKNAAGTDVTINTTPAAGRVAAAESMPVVLSNEDQTSVGALTETAPASDTASSGLNGRLQRIAQRLTSLIGLLPATLGQQANATSLSVSLATEQDAQLGSLTETAPASDTASSGLNGRLQRISQRLTSVIALLPSALGAGGGLKVDGSSVPLPVVGTVAHDGVDSGNPQKIGLQARTTWPAAVSDADRVNAIGDKYGRTIVVNTPRELRSRQVTTIASSTSETTIITAGGAGVFRDAFLFVITNTSATACNVTIRDATAGSVVVTLAIPAGQTVGFALPSGDAIKQTAAANNWTATCSASVASIVISAFFVNNADA